MIYFLIVNYYASEYIQNLINSFHKFVNGNYQVVVVNNSPQDNGMKQLSTHHSIILLESPGNLGFGGGCNVGLEYIYERENKAIVWIINPDTYVQDNVVHIIKSFFDLHPDISILGTMTETQNQEIWFAGGHFNSHTGAISHVNLLTDMDVAECDWVSGCSLILNLQNFHQCPQFDPAYFLYYEDFDFCRRYALAGYKIYVTKKVVIYHRPSSITDKYIFRKIHHSTYGYLLTLKRYAPTYILLLRLIRLLIYALVLIPIKPQTALGKLYGVLRYFYHQIVEVVSKVISNL